jgi:hypothetical protein
VEDDGLTRFGPGVTENSMCYVDKGSALNILEWVVSIIKAMEEGKTIKEKEVEVDRIGREGSDGTGYDRNCS